VSKNEMKGLKMRTILSIILISLLSALAVPSHAAKKKVWPTYKFTIIHEDPDSNPLPSPSNEQDKAFNPETRKQEYLAREKLNPLDGSNTISSSNITSNIVAVDLLSDRKIEEYLEKTAKELAKLGFRPPNLQMKKTIKGKTYLIYLTDLTLEGDDLGRHYVSKSGASILVYYTPDIYGPQSTVLTEGYLTLGHELFHAVQQRYVIFQDFKLQKWIMEGTADAVGIDMAFNNAPAEAMKNAEITDGSSLSPNIRWGNRDYSTGLVRINDDSSYHTSSLWRFIAEYTSTKRKPTLKVPKGEYDYGYLADFFEKNLKDAKGVGKKVRERREIQWLDDNLRKTKKDEKSLSVLYPEFITLLANFHPDRAGAKDHKIYKPFKTQKERKKWLGKTFEKHGCEVVKLYPDNKKPEKRTLKFDKISAACLRVTLMIEDAKHASVMFGVTGFGGGVVTYREDEINSLKKLGWKIAKTDSVAENIKMVDVRVGKIEGKRINGWLITDVPTQKPVTFILSSVSKEARDSPEDFIVELEISPASIDTKWTKIK
jgi:hypothetical protein